MNNSIYKTMLPRTKNRKLVPLEQRLEFVNNLFAQGGELDNEYLEFYEHLGKMDFDKISAQERKSLNWQWQKQSLPCEEAANYLTSCKRSKEDVTCYDEEDLERRYHDPSMRKVKKTGKDKRRKDYIPSEPGEDEYEERPRLHSIINISRLRRDAIDAVDDYTDYDIAEKISYKSGARDFERSAEAAFMDSQLLDLFPDSIEHQIAELILGGKQNVDIYEELGITKRQLDTVFKHMRNRWLKNAC